MNEQWVFPRELFTIRPRAIEARRFLWKMPIIYICLQISREESNPWKNAKKKKKIESNDEKALGMMLNYEGIETINFEANKDLDTEVARKIRERYSEDCFDFVKIKMVDRFYVSDADMPARPIPEPADKLHATGHTGPPKLITVIPVFVLHLRMGLVPLEILDLIFLIRLYFIMVRRLSQVRLSLI